MEENNEYVCEFVERHHQTSIEIDAVHKGCGGMVNYKPNTFNVTSGGEDPLGLSLEVEKVTTVEGICSRCGAKGTFVQRVKSSIF